MAARISTVWPRFIGDAGNPPTYRVVLDGMELPTVYADRSKAKAMADQYNAAAEFNAHDIYSRAT
jgi:hypothetical protein